MAASVDFDGEIDGDYRPGVGERNWNDKETLLANDEEESMTPEGNERGHPVFVFVCCESYWMWWTLRNVPFSLHSWMNEEWGALLE